MQLMLRLLLIGIILFGGNDLWAQKKKNPYSIKNKRAIEAYQASENFMMRRQYGQAVQLLQDALKREPEFVEARLRLAGIYRSVGSKEKAWEQLQLVLRDENELPLEGYYAIGELAWQLGKYAEAEAALTRFLAGKPTRAILQEEAERMLASSKFAQEQLKNPVDFNPTPLPAPLNQFQQQYFPVLTVDQQAMIYTVLQPTGDEDIFIARKNAEGNWQTPEPLAKNINTSSNEGTCTISADGRTLIFTSCRGRGGVGSCDLYISFKEGDAWSEPENLGRPVNSRSWESQPSLSADGQTLYFVSDRPGGYGQRDIYMSKRGEDGLWQEPANLGNTINTRYDEVSPYIHVNGQTLYFASTGHPGMGGFDLFITELDEQLAWQKVRNLGYPVNAADDQVSLFVTADGAQGYYVQEAGRGTRQATSKLYMFEVPEGARVKNRSNYVTGKISDRESGTPLKARVSLYDIVSNRELQRVSSDSITGSYTMVLTEGSQYAVYAERPGYLFASLAFDASQVAPGEPIQVNISLEPIRSGARTQLNNIFFESDSYALDNKSKGELQKIVKFLKINSNLKVQIEGHTDNVGMAAYNQKLSENRANAVRDFLTREGIPKEQLKAVGFGQTQPLMPNDVEENRAKNRRIVFVIL